MAEIPTLRDDWRPIESAPKDGELVLVAEGQYVVEARDIDGQWYELNNDPTDSWGRPWYEGEATHWMPLPSPPASETAPGNDEKRKS